MLEFGAIREVISQLHGPGATPTALLGRFKYFQRLGWPGRSNVGRGSRASYGVEDVFALALAFELQQTGAAPVRVVRLLRPSWSDIMDAIASTWTGLSNGRTRRLVLVQRPGALAELGLEPGPEAPAPDPLIVSTEEQVAEALLDPTAAGGASPGIYVIRLDGLVRDVVAALLATGAASTDDLSLAFEYARKDAAD